MTDKKKVSELSDEYNKWTGGLFDGCKTNHCPDG